LSYPPNMLSVKEGKLVPNETGSKMHSHFETCLLTTKTISSGRTV